MKDTNKILESIRKGEDDKALRYLYKDPLNKIRKYVLSNSGTMEDADDIFQDAVVTLFHYVKKGKYKTEYDLDGFLFRVARNSWIDKVRNSSKFVKQEFRGFDLSDSDDDQLDEIIQKEKLSVFHLIFNKLEDKCKQILHYAVFEKKSMKEIKSLLGYKDEKVVKTQHYRCKQYFSKLLAANKEALNILRN